MQGMDSRVLRCARARARIRFTILVMTLSVISGCASGGKVKPEPVAEVSAEAQGGAVVASGPAVTRLNDGREGFIITENPPLDADSRRDFERAVSLMEAEDFGKAVELLEKIVEKSPGVTAPHIDLAIAYEHTEKLESAEQQLKIALSLVPDHPVAGNEYGLLLRKTGRFTEARAIYEKTLATFPEYLPARRNLGILCDLYLNDQACALEQYETYSKAVPGDEQVKIWLADLRVRLGQQ